MNRRYEINGVREKEWKYIASRCGIVMWINVKNEKDLNYPTTQDLVRLERRVQETLSGAKKANAEKLNEVVWALNKMINFGVDALDDA